jgi:FkbM family methyltransferase
MLIPIDEIKRILLENNISIKGAFHIGAHECEELGFYTHIGINPHDVVWIDALPNKVREASDRGIPNVYHAVITDQNDQEVVFHVANNGQSSSVLEFGTHSEEHPWVVYVDQIKQQSVTIDTFFERNNIDVSRFDFWNFDIQGAELIALQGATQSIQHAKAIYLEVNEKELYRGCGLIDRIDAFLAQYNFKRVVTEMTSHGWGDALYILTK